MWCGCLNKNSLCSTICMSNCILIGWTVWWWQRIRHTLAFLIILRTQVYWSTSWAVLILSQQLLFYDFLLNVIQLSNTNIPHFVVLSNAFQFCILSHLTFTTHSNNSSLITGFYMICFDAFNCRLVYLTSAFLSYAESL